MFPSTLLKWALLRSEPISTIPESSSFRHKRNSPMKKFVNVTVIQTFSTSSRNVNHANRDFVLTICDDSHSRLQTKAYCPESLTRSFKTKLLNGSFTIPLSVDLFPVSRDPTILLHRNQSYDSVHATTSRSREGSLFSKCSNLGAFPNRINAKDRRSLATLLHIGSSLDQSVYK